MDSSILDLFSQFLRACVHNILFLRNVYPPELFDRVRLYNVPIRQIRSELVSNYIRDVIDSILPWLEAGILEKLCIQIEDKTRRPLSGAYEALFKAEETPGVLEGWFKNFIVKLQSCNAHLEPLTHNQGLNWQVLAFTSPDVEQCSKVMSWIDADPNCVLQNPSTCRIVPLKTFQSEHLNMQLYIEKL